MKDAIAVNMAQVAKQITIRVRLKGARRFRFRLWIAKQLFRFAGSVVAGIPTDVSIENT